MYSLTCLPTYARVRYRSVYPGVDVVYRDGGGRLAHDFLVAPGADPGAIRLAFDGVQSIALASDGDPVLRTAAGDLRLARPISYQGASTHASSTSRCP
ncbi:MAG TPA: hypothetical protein VML54_08405 [Candidatus Limnocylindrales bacterium]|nr:hypothetical protein [Candidatus Limnocylindrales bacterium]